METRFALNTRSRTCASRPASSDRAVALYWLMGGGGNTLGIRMKHLISDCALQRSLLPFFESKGQEIMKKIVRSK